MERYDVIKDLKNRSREMAYKARVHDNFVQTHTGDGKTPKKEVQREKDLAAYYEDARISVDNAIRVLNRCPTERDDV